MVPEWLLLNLVIMAFSFNLTKYLE